MKVIALIPAYNEEQYIAETLEAVCSIVALDEVLVINDGSTDNTREWWKKFGRKRRGP